MVVFYYELSVCLLHSMYKGLFGGEKMKKMIIKVASVTYAMKGKSVLQSQGIRARIVKTSNPKKTEGCGYSIVVENPQLNVPEILRRANVEIIETKWET